MIAVLDYGAGNLRSVEKALRHIGCDVAVTGDAEVLRRADGAVLPGVGAFGDAMKELRARGLEAPIKAYIKEDRPFLGICLGLQVLFESSEESPGAKGLGVLRGAVLRIPGDGGRKVPHIGWNSLDILEPGGLFAGLGPEPYTYFVHSYYVAAKEPVVTATAEYGVSIHAAVRKGNLFAVQFHPEKSGATGLAMLRNFAAVAEKGGA